ncbi:similar to Saccharomyces cerevisiae YPL133C RDS2 Transcription factor involved in regulating gluconeogenesis and glyoxylate cycle genes [Maudiozyma saulgeensis]|uniref:Similar to Saccharomyces cerevisiae YPL133C RDS2 Transcription factor involved in regulating gluconeogenesis and glyoxylate cycle genes n=1 Tax=Maudiozyma saulgeensis TaxID=1789683 RepID=A0A1X7R953_9SACH|nr:similar to Saccharomyces cerevisiae YPL133C RDS2 Transcription factor involved in regulating gluconeogenesis and glyoxylate cycle genes [Kazachstania saulgeensis]
MSETRIKKKRVMRRSCVFCRRSHVNCDDHRPCARCIKRNIAHLCSDTVDMDTTSSTTKTKQTTTKANVISTNDILPSSNITNLLGPQSFVSENMGSEFSSLNEFLSMLEEPLQLPSEPLVTSGTVGSSIAEVSYQPLPQTQQFQSEATSPPLMLISGTGSALPISPSQYSNVPPSISQQLSNNSTNDNNSTVRQLSNEQEHLAARPPILQPTSLQATFVKPTAKEQFFLTAADPNTEITPEEKLKSVINAKLKAGLLKPYNYAAGYTRLQEYMKKNMSEESQKRILYPLDSIRPAFRSIAKSLKDVDLVLVEEGFERMLLSYDRVFTSMSMPACLWRRTGEIYRANKEFASLVGVTVDDLRDGKLAIYELMGEHSAVNFWEKYGSVAFDKGQKAVLTSCTLISRDSSRQNHNCCFSFTIRRDRYNIPICIVGNFIPVLRDN